jgi:hypothetical protein
MTVIADNLEKIRERIRRYELKYHRAQGSVRLLAASKGRSIAEIRSAMDGGQRDFGENYLQEAAAKMEILNDPSVCWHFIGPVQSNKCRGIAARFAWVHSLDRMKIARRLNDMRPDAAPPLNVCIEINISGETTKSGVAPEKLPGLAEAISGMPRLRLRGLMAMPEPAADIAAQRGPLRRLFELYTQLQAKGLPLDTLSAGTTDDMEAAIAEGSTLVRIGTAIFGPRP